MTTQDAPLDRARIVKAFDVLPPGPYEVRWPSEQGGAFTLWGRTGTPPDFKDGWAIPLVASGVDTAIYALRDILAALAPSLDTPPPPRLTFIDPASGLPIPPRDPAVQRLVEAARAGYDELLGASYRTEAEIEPRIKVLDDIAGSLKVFDL